MHCKAFHTFIITTPLKCNPTHLLLNSLISTHFGNFRSNVKVHFNRKDDSISFSSVCNVLQSREQPFFFFSKKLKFKKRLSIYLIVVKIATIFSTIKIIPILSSHNHRPKNKNSYQESQQAGLVGFPFLVKSLRNILTHSYGENGGNLILLCSLVLYLLFSPALFY